MHSLFGQSATLILLTILSTIFGCGQSKPVTVPNDTLVFVVRHAEKADLNDPDTPLSASGKERAEALARKLRNENVGRIYATTLKRTQQTVAPLAEASGLTIVQLEPGETSELVRRIKEDDQGKVVVVAGHSNTVPEIVEALSGKTIDPISEAQFDRLYRIHLPLNGAPELTLLHFGVGTP